MLERLGEVLYWGFCLLALIPLGMLWMAVDSNGWKLDTLLLFGMPAVICWLIGRAAKYVLSSA
jgi:hypothetical protein